MLKLKNFSALIATTVLMIPTVLSLPVNAETNIYRVRNHVVVESPAKKVVRLPNGDLRLPNRNVIPAKKVVRLPNGYMRLPSGHIISPNGDFFDTRDIIVLSNGRRILPNGVVIVIDN